MFPKPPIAISKVPVEKNAVALSPVVATVLSPVFVPEAVPPPVTRVPVVAGKVRTIPVPATAFGWSDTFPDVEPAKRITPKVVPAVPMSSNAPGPVVPMPTLPEVGCRIT